MLTYNTLLMCPLGGKITEKTGTVENMNGPIAFKLDSSNNSKLRIFHKIMSIQSYNIKSITANY